MLDGFSIIRVEGEDAETFLQGQLSGDIRDVTAEARFSTYSTAKGRMLASFLVWQQQAVYYLMVSADICQAIAKRLTMFVMRSKVKVNVVDAAQTSIAGVRGVQLAVIEQYLQTGSSPLP
jgi:folate-binding Fe-S cluster repair protein YgfZ